MAIRDKWDHVASKIDSIIWQETWSALYATEDPNWLIETKNGISYPVADASQTVRYEILKATLPY